MLLQLQSSGMWRRAHSWADRYKFRRNKLSLFQVWMFSEELKWFLLTFERIIKIGVESELTVEGDNRGQWEEGVEGWVGESKEEGKECNTINQNKTKDLGLLFCSVQRVTTFLRNTIYKTARCHNQESADHHRHCRHNVITSQLWVQLCRYRWQCAINCSTAAGPLRYLSCAGSALCNEMITRSGDAYWMRVRVCMCVWLCLWVCLMVCNVEIYILRRSSLKVFWQQA
jgi:hypothetical protein